MKYLTDKVESGLAYEYLLMFLISGPVKVLEVGSYQNGFLKWWKNNFPSSQVYGIDNKAVSITEEEYKDIVVENLDQNDTEKLTDFCKRHGSFDVIIDDASHCEKETENTFKTLWPFIIPGGWYVIEDWGASYFQHDMGKTYRIIADMILNKGELGIGETKIICREKGISIAFFRKG